MPRPRSLLDRATPPAHAGAEADDAAPGLDEWARVGHAMRIAAFAVWGGLFSLYLKVWFNPRVADGYLPDFIERVWKGTQDAPFQYRFAIPDLIVWLDHTFGWGVGPISKAIDFVGLAIGAWLLDRFLRRVGLGEWTIPAALYGGFLGIGVLWWGKPETMVAFAVVTLAVTALVTDGRWRVPTLLACGVVLLGMRTDLTIALGVGLAARWFWGERRRVDLQLGIALGVLGLGATVALTRIWPDAEYTPGTDVVQVIHNVNPAIWLTALAFLLPALLPWALVNEGPRMRRAIAPHRGLTIPLLAMVLAEVGATCLVGRVEEVRLFFPLTAPLAALGIVGWRAALSLAPGRSGADTALSASAPAR